MTGHIDRSPVPGYDGEVRRHGDTLYVDLWYPNVGDDPVSKIQVSLMHVRASDDIVIAYDFERDGWTISRSNEGDDDGRELAFIPAWDDEEEPTDDRT